MRYFTDNEIMTEKVEESCCSVNECQAREIAFILLNPRSSDLLEKLIVPWLVKKMSTFWGTGKFVTMFTTAHKVSLSCGRYFKPTFLN